LAIPVRPSLEVTVGMAEGGHGTTGLAMVFGHGHHHHHRSSLTTGWKWSPTARSTLLPHLLI
jgi:hypothetical protein